MTLVRSLAAAMLALVLASPDARAQAPVPDGIQRVTSVEGITEYRLENGLRVLLFPDPSKATVTVNITYLVGSVDESYGETGMAHLLEHMLFKGSPRHPEIPMELQDRGAQFNGTTAWERTNYFETLDATEDNLEWALDLEADRMVNSFVSQEDLDSEMTVVRNEFEAGENNALSVLLYRVLSTAYLWHGYGNTPIGSRSDIENVPIDRLQAFYRRFYQPDNAVLVVAGRIDEGRTLGLIDQYLGSIPRPERVLIENYTEEPTQDGEREVTLRRVGDVQFLMAGHHAPHGAHPDFVPLQIAAQILAVPPSGRLYQAMVETGIASVVGNTELQLKDPGMAILYAVVREDGSLEEARETFLATIDGIADNPFTAEEVDRTRNRILSQVEQQMNDSQGIAQQLSDWAAIGDWRLLFLDRDRVSEVDAAEVQRVALKYLKPSNRTIGVFIPDSAPDRAEMPEAPDVVAMLEGYTGNEARSEGEVFDATPANIEIRTNRDTLPGGIRLVLLPKETRGDVVQASIRLNFGDEDSLGGRAVAGQIVGQMLMRGTTTRTRQQIQDELDRLQSQLDVGGNATGVTATIESTHENLAAVLEVTTDVLRNPSFPENELETLRDSALASIEFARSEPQVVVNRAFARHQTPYGPDDVRYVATLDEEIERLQGVTLGEIRRFHSDFYGASNAEIVIVGDFDPAQVREVIANGLDGWDSPQPYERVYNEYPQEVEPTSEAFETPDKENAFFMAGMAIDMNDAHPDYPAMVLGNYILGQGFNSRLLSRIRGEEGLSYGISSTFQAQPTVNGARFVANAIAAPQNTEQLEASFRDELTSILRDGYTDEEVEAAKISWAQARQVGRTQDEALASTLLTHARNGRTMTWDVELEAAVQSLTREDILEAMQRHLSLDRMTFMKGGDFAGAEASQ